MANQFDTYQRNCAIYLDASKIITSTCWWLRHLLCIGSCTSTNFRSISFFQQFPFFWRRFPCIHIWQKILTHFKGIARFAWTQPQPHFLQAPVGGSAIYFALAQDHSCSCMSTNFRSISPFFNNVSFFSSCSLYFNRFPSCFLHALGCFHPFPFFWRRFPCVHLLPIIFTHLGELRDLLGHSHVSYMHLLVVAPSSLHWPMFAHALACLLIFSQSPLYFQQPPLFSSCLSGFFQFPFMFSSCWIFHPFPFFWWHFPLYS